MKNLQHAASDVLAEYFHRRSDSDTVISQVFDYFGFDCMVRSHLDASELDFLIRQYLSAGDVSVLSSVIELLRQGKKDADGSESRRIVLEIKNYILQRLTEDMTMESVASQLHLSYYYFCHLFKQQTGQSPNAFRTEKRLEKAMRLLSKDGVTVSQAALESGFNNTSYFSETFIKCTGFSPRDFKTLIKGKPLHAFSSFRDMVLTARMPSVFFLDEGVTDLDSSGMRFSSVHLPGKEYGAFLHEAAIIEFEGVLYASWYNCDEKELVGYTPIRQRRSFDGGLTWTEPETIAEDKSGKILFCPPVYGICDGKLYLLLNQMVAPDHIHSLDLYVLTPETDRFERLWSRPIPFKINTNVFTLPDGRLMIPGRIAELDGFPNTPGVLISDSGKIDGEWRMVFVAPNGMLPDGEELVHPETTLLCCDGILYLFNRNDKRGVPLVYTSCDLGEHWSDAACHDIPYISSKIYTGQLSDGRYFLIANTDHFDRSKLSLYVSDGPRMKFTKSMVLKDCRDGGDGIFRCHYPAAAESQGKLYIIATADYRTPTLQGRGAVLFTVPLSEL